MSNRGSGGRGDGSQDPPMYPLLGRREPGVNGSAARHGARGDRRMAAGAAASPDFCEWLAAGAPSEDRE